MQANMMLLSIARFLPIFIMEMLIDLFAKSSDIHISNARGPTGNFYFGNKKIHEVLGFGPTVGSSSSMYILSLTYLDNISF